MTVGPEYTEVEKPLIDQLAGLGWTHLEGAPPGTVTPSDPRKSGRTSFADVFLLDRLRAQIKRINRGPDGQPWLDDRRVSQAVSALTRLTATSLLDANQQATELLLKGTTVEGLPGWDGGRDQRVHYIDWQNWEDPAANDFVVVSQFRVDIPGGQGRNIVPDEVLFVNGIPLALIECKAPDSHLGKAVDQHLRYSERRGATTREGNEKLFHTMQVLVATSGDKATVGSITSGPEHYARWHDEYPYEKDELARLLGKPEQAVTAQDVLTGVVLHPARLLDITHNYVTFMKTDEGKTIKAVPRYQQYRAVSRAVDRLLTGDTRARSDDDKDHRSGVVWHTQGSGKSLTMSFLVRKARTVPALVDTKIVIVTDRNDLQTQLSDTLALTGETVTTAPKIRQARQLLSQPGPGIVCVTIQKQQDPDARKNKPSDQDILTGKTPGFPELNSDESIVLLIDEAHRSHGSQLHLNLMKALPNAARIGFTGTPILMGSKTWTTTTFGPYIDIYRLADAERDGAVVPILYSGRRVKGAVRDGGDMDEVFEDLLDELTPDEIEQIKRRYATKAEVMEAEELIAAKARNILRHFVQTVWPNGFKAQIAAHSRKAAVRYRAALIQARDEMIAKNRLKLSPEQIERVKQFDFVPVISPGENDPKDWEPWTGNADPVIGSFKNPSRQPTFLIVKSMLLTGFDAPVEQVLYLDRAMKEAELLQAIARVNRPATGTNGALKECGYVVDYAGVTDDLTKALKAYAAEDVEGVLKQIQTDQVGALRAQRDRLWDLFANNPVRSVTPGTSTEAIEECVQVLADDTLRARFDAELRVFLSTVDTVLPMTEAEPFLGPAKLYAEIAKRARRRYRDSGDFDPSLYGEKIRELIDEHMVSLGIDQVLPPVSITDPEYQAKAARLGVRARVSEMEHAIRHHISVRMDTDPVRYRRLSERLEEILAEHDGNWDQQARALSEFLARIQDEDSRTDSGDSPGPSRLEHAMYSLLLEETVTDGIIGDEEGQRLAAFCRDCHALAVKRTTRPDFWRHPVDQTDFTKEITVQLIMGHVCPDNAAPTLADKLVDIIRANRGSITSHG